MDRIWTYTDAPVNPGRNGIMFAMAIQLLRVLIAVVIVAILISTFLLLANRCALFQPIGTAVNSERRKSFVELRCFRPHAIQKLDKPHRNFMTFRRLETNHVSSTDAKQFRAAVGHTRAPANRKTDDFSRG